jgi:hypothetical protein
MRENGVHVAQVSAKVLEEIGELALAMLNHPACGPVLQAHAERAP